MSDPLAELSGGEKPHRLLKDGETVEMGSKTRSSKYTVKRTADHYYCSCPAWRNQSRVKVDVRTCKHLKELLGEAYELARTTSAVAVSKPAGKATTSTSKSAKEAKSQSSGTRSRKRKAPEDDEEEQEQKPASSSKDDEESKSAQKNSAQPPADDELAEINGVKPKTYLKDGEEQEAKSQTSSSVYKIKRTWDHYYCTCPAWRNQSRSPTNARTCKHLKALLGEAYEEARLKFKNPDGDHSSSSNNTGARASKRQKKDSGDGSGSSGNAKVEPKLLLAVKWDLATGSDPTGWWMSEKLDARTHGFRTHRVYYDGKKMWSRLGNAFTPPKEFLDRLPKDVTLDGELFGGRGKFQDTVSVVKTVNSPHWQKITFQAGPIFFIFDIPSRSTEPFEERIDYLKKNLANIPQVNVVEHTMCKSREHLLETLKEVERQGGEGVMMRQPASPYEGKRSSTLLKVKTFYDAEAEVVGYEPGKGKHKGVTGALKCVMASGKARGPKFNVGTGLSDKQRRSPPKIGEIVTYRFQELTRDGVPRQAFPSFVGVCIDKDKPTDAPVPDHKIPGKGTSDD
ncbi:ATP-dependent DNA ligase [Ceratobasidium sp. AG-Ba]|nr:ATP-dependent DNA ligase [Ceratobasidium sp. AG-Ba]